MGETGVDPAFQVKQWSKKLPAKFMTFETTFKRD